MDGGVWWAVVHGFAKSRMWLSDFTFTFYFHALEKEMATHSSVLAWRIPGTGSLVGCPLWGCTELDRTDVTAATYHISHAYMWIISILLSDLAYIDHKHLQFQTSLLFFFFFLLHRDVVHGINILYHFYWISILYHLFLFFFFDAYLFLAVLGLAGFSLVAASRGYSLVVVHELLITMVSLVAEHRLYVTWASVVVAPRL